MFTTQNNIQKILFESSKHFVTAKQTSFCCSMGRFVLHHDPVLSESVKPTQLLPCTPLSLLERSWLFLASTFEMDSS